MKNLVKELEWEPYVEEDGAKADTGPCGIFFAFSTNSGYRGDLSGYDGDAWTSSILPTLDAAKAACQQHYEKMVLSGLTARAKVAVSIGMATLAQLDVTDEALAEIIKQNS